MSSEQYRHDTRLGRQTLKHSIYSDDSLSLSLEHATTQERGRTDDDEDDGKFFLLLVLSFSNNPHPRVEERTAVSNYMSSRLKNVPTNEKPLTKPLD